MFSADPITNRINLSHAEQRSKLFEGLKNKLVHTNISDNRNFYRQTDLPHSDLNQQTVSLSESLKDFLSEGLSKKFVKENPFFDATGSYIPLKDTEYDRWFFDRVSNMKSYTACKDEQIRELKQYLKDTRSMSRKERKQEKRDSIFK